MAEKSDIPRPFYRRDAEGGGTGPEQDDPRAEAWRREQLAERDPYFYADRNFQRTIDDLRTIHKLELKKELTPEEEKSLEDAKGKLPEELTPEEEKSLEDAKERLPKNWEGLMGMQLKQLEVTLDQHLLRFKSPYPYDSRMQEGWFENLESNVAIARTEEWAQTPEAEKTLDTIDIDRIWGESNFRNITGLGSIVPYMFDGKLMMQWVSRPRERDDPVQLFYEGAYAKELPGLSLTGKERPALPEAFPEGLREKAVKYQDESTFWRMAVAEVHQMDYDDKGNPIPSFMINQDGERTLTDREIDFIHNVFGVRDSETGEVERVTYKGREDVPEAILNWYSMESTEDNKRRYFAIMEALLVHDAKNLLGDSRVGEEEYENLVEEILEETDERVKNWRSPKRSLDQRLAAVVTKSGIITDWGHMSASRLGWGWDYEKENGKVTRERSVGSTIVATDSSTPMYWRELERTNSDKWWTRGFMPAMSDEHRAILAEHPPDWKPDYLEDEAKKDVVLQAALKELWSGDWDPKLKEKLKEMMWYWETPYKDENGNNIIIPMFFPPEFASLNYLNTVNASKAYEFPASEEEKKETGKDKKEIKRTIWQELCAGKKMSKMQWTKPLDQALYRWMVTINQMYRIFRVESEKKGGFNRQQFADFFNHEDNLPELKKRTDLTDRDELDDQEVLTIAIMPKMIAFEAARANVMLKPAATDKDQQQFWVADVARRMAVLHDIPDRRGEDKVKRTAFAMNKLVVFYSNLMWRASQIESKRKKKLEEAYKTDLVDNLQSTTGKKPPDAAIIRTPRTQRT